YSSFLHFNMNKEQLIEKISSKKEFSDLPRKDVGLAFEKFDKPEYTDEEKVDYTRDLLRKVFSAFVSQKILSLKDKDEEWVLRKHISTKERLENYEELYSKLLEEYENVSVVDFGAGVNGFSYKFFPSDVEVSYLAIESMGQLVDLINYYFEKQGIEGKAVKESLFDLENVKKEIGKYSFHKVGFLFKTVDSLEMLKWNYSKEFLKEIVPLFEKVVISFATRSLISKKKFVVDRSWIVNYLEEQFEVLEDFELGNERYLVISG
ncbi:MAG: hypothetical protein ABEI74_03265, partial [Candidatus Pacearchaeota archaeon]